MNVIRTSQCNKTYVAEGCGDLPAFLSVEEGYPTVSTFWAPSDDERALLAAGFPVKLTIVGTNPQPVRMEVDTL